MFAADTVYGLACDPGNEAAVQRLYALKGRDTGRPAAVMFFDLAPALETLAEVGDRTREALGRLLPGAVTVLLANPAGRYPLACASDPGTLGLRVPRVPALDGVRVPVLQSSANASGARDARSLSQVPEAIRAGADLVLDGGELPGTPSTVVDLRGYERDGSWAVMRIGAVGEGELADALRGH